MGACEYDHYHGDKLSQRNIEVREEDGWKLLSHVVTTGDVHNYTFKRMKEENAVSQ